MYKKAFLALIPILFLFSITFAQVDVEHVSQATVRGNEVFTVNLKVTMTGPQNAVDVAELLPAGWEIISWEINGYDKSQVSYEWLGAYVFSGKERSSAHWNLKNVQNDFTITYQTKAVSENIQTEFVTLLVYPSGFTSKTSIISVSPGAGTISCGDGVCGVSENIFNCPSDCKLELQLPSTDIMITIASIIIAIITVAITYKLRHKIAEAGEGIAVYLPKKKEMPPTEIIFPEQRKMVKEYAKKEEEERINLPPIKKYSEAEAMRRLKLIAGNKKKKFKKYKKKK